LNETDNVIHLLETLVNSTIKAQRTKSFVELRKMDT